MNPSPIVAFAFANLAILGWLAAAAAPIVIHLWMRQTHRETPWAAVRFLRAALERQARRLRLQHWVLLAIRTAILLLIVLAAAKPVFESGLLGSGQPTWRLLVIDASLSMSRLDEAGSTRLERAKRLAKSLVEQSRAGDSYSLLVMGSRAATPVARPIVDTDEVVRAIDAVAASQGVADLRRSLVAAKRLIDTHAGEPRPKPCEVILFSDRGANSWGPLAQPKGPLAEACDAVLEAARVSLVDVAAEAPRVNSTLTRLELVDPLPTLVDPIEVRAEVLLHGAGEAQRRVAELLVNGRVVAEQAVTLSPGQSTAIDFSHRLRESGQLPIAVRLAGDDALPGDDARWLAVAARDRVRVLCVAGKRGAADYLAFALDPAGRGDSPFQPVVVSDADLSSRSLDEFDCLLLSNVEQLSDEEAGRLERYVAEGGGVVFFLGDRVNTRRYNETLKAPKAGAALGGHRLIPPVRMVSEDPSPAPASLLPGRLGEPVSRPSYRVDPLSYRHPIAGPFRGQERAGLLTTPVARYVPLLGAKESSVALALENGDPLLATCEYGGGRCALVTTAGSLESIDPATGGPWTVMPAWPSFLPIVRQLVRHVAAPEQTSEALLVGEPVGGHAATRGTNKPLRVVRPDGSTETLTLSGDGAWSYDRADVAGVYRFGREGEGDLAARAVNIDPAEGDPRQTPFSELPKRIERHGAATGGGVGDRLEQPDPLHRLFLLAALLLALVESGLACWFGRGSA